MVVIERTQEIADTIHGTIAYSGIEAAVIGTPIFNRLHRILQSSMVFLTFPSNKVKRFEHSIGVMHLSGKMFFHSICNSKPDQLKIFFDEVNSELIKWNSSKDITNIPYIHKQDRSKYSKDKILNFSIPTCRLYIQNMPANITASCHFGYCVTYQAIRLAGLLHDVGHLPYSHVLEYSLQSLYKKVSEIPEDTRKEAHNYFLTVMEHYCNPSSSEQSSESSAELSSEPPSSEFALHEELGQKFVDKIFENITEDLTKEEGSSYYFLAAVLYFTKSILAAKEGNYSLFSDLHRIIAGTLDSDRMDYCYRDTYCAGTSKELPNYGRIFSTISIQYQPVQPGLACKDIPEEKRSRYCCFMPSTKAIHEIENLLRCRWDIYATINYHHRVHKHEALLIRVLTQLGLDEMNNSPKPEDLSSILPLKISSIWQLVAQINDTVPVDYLAIQLDDGWMDTLLKHEYFRKYGNSYFSFLANGKDIMWHQLDELISTQKHYFTLFKRPGGFRQFDVCFYDELKKRHPSSKPKSDNQQGEGYSKFVADGKEYIFNLVLREIFKSKIQREQFISIFDTRVSQFVQKEGEAYNIQDCFLVANDFSLGIKLGDTLYIASSRQNAKPFIHYSPLYDILSSEKKLLPSVHIYYLPVYNVKGGRYEDVNIEAITSTIARIAVDVLFELKDPSQVLEQLPTLP